MSHKNNLDLGNEGQKRITELRRNRSFQRSLSHNHALYIKEGETWVEIVTTTV